MPFLADSVAISTAPSRPPPAPLRCCHYKTIRTALAVPYLMHEWHPPAGWLVRIESGRVGWSALLWTGSLEGSLSASGACAGAGEARRAGGTGRAGRGSLASLTEHDPSNIEGVPMALENSLIRPGKVRDCVLRALLRLTGVRQVLFNWKLWTRVSWSVYSRMTHRHRGTAARPSMW